MDTKMRVLQALIGQAQQQAQRLEAAIDKAERLGIAECHDTSKEIKRATSQPLVMDNVNNCMDSSLPQLEPARFEQIRDFAIRFSLWRTADSPRNRLRTRSAPRWAKWK